MTQPYGTQGEPAKGVQTATGKEAYIPTNKQRWEPEEGRETREGDRLFTAQFGDPNYRHNHVQVPTSGSADDIQERTILLSLEITSIIKETLLCR